MNISLPIKGKTFAEQLTSRDVAKKISARIYHLPAKQLARAGGCSVQTAKNAKRGNTALSAAHLLNAARGVPELHQLLLELLGITPDEAEFYSRFRAMMAERRG